MEAKGKGGKISIEGGFITISHKGLLGVLTQGLNGEKRIPVKSVISVQFKKAGPLADGYIQIATSASEGRGGSVAGRLIADNSIIFSKPQQGDFEQIRDEIEKIIGGSSNVTQVVNQVDVADQIMKLAALRDQGILTEDEFAMRKEKLLK